MQYDNQRLINDYTQARQASVDACRELEVEDYGLQGAVFVSPPKWHLAHTSWFFETFILKPFQSNFQVFEQTYELLFNSYYNAVGEQFPRSERGLLSRPTVKEVMTYRKAIDRAMLALLDIPAHPQSTIIAELCRLGIEHEKQHQELFFSDIKYSLFKNPLHPGVLAKLQPEHLSTDTNWCDIDGGLIEIGTDNDKAEFSFDNESPRHVVYLPPFAIACRLVTNAEFQGFIDDGGYQRAELWLADGWALVERNGWTRPLYWLDKKMHFTLQGVQVREDQAAACHISAYEADAYANWVGARLPTEAEWEHAVAHGQLKQVDNTRWQWTASAYRPYPGFSKAPGAIGEYNGKFMCNQWVLRGGSCATSANHARLTYRNFFYPGDRWQFSGIRLAKSNSSY